MKLSHSTESINRHLRRSSNRRNTAPTSLWMVSFGDLITLLFCLFLTLRTSGVFTIAHPTDPNSTSGPPFAAEIREVGGSSKKRHPPAQVYLTADDLTDITALQNRLKEMIPSAPASVTISTLSCRSPGSAALLVDFAHIEGATASFGLPRTFGVQHLSCPEVEGKPSVATVTIRDLKTSISVSPTEEEETR